MDSFLMGWIWLINSSLVFALLFTLYSVCDLKPLVSYGSGFCGKRLNCACLTAVLFPHCSFTLHVCSSTVRVQQVRKQALFVSLTV